MDQSALEKIFKSLLRGDQQASVDLYEYVKLHPEQGKYFVTPLRDALSNLETRDYAAFALAEIGPAAARAVPELINALSYDPVNYIASPFAEALGNIGKAAKDAVPALIDALDVEDAQVDYHVAVALGKIGPDAAIAIPKLEKLMQESDDTDVREAASIAVSLIREK